MTFNFFSTPKSYQQAQVSSVEPEVETTDTVEQSTVAPQQNEVAQSPIGDLQLFEQLGVSSNGNTVGYTDLNNKMRKMNLDSYTRYKVQQEWLKGFDAYYNTVQSPVERDELKAMRQRILANPATLQEDSEVGSKVESLGQGIDAMQGGTQAYLAKQVSKIDKSDSEIEKEIADEHKEKYERYLKAKAIYDDKARLISSDPSNLNMIMGDPNFLRKRVRAGMDTKDLVLIDWFNELHDGKRMGVAFASDDANDVTKWLRQSVYENMRDASRQSKYVGRDERRQAIMQAGKDENGNSLGIGTEAWETAKASILDLSAAVDVGLRSTGSQLIPQLAGVVIGGLTRNPLLYQAISALGNFPAEIQSQFAEKLAELSAKKYKKSIDQLTDDEFKILMSEHGAEFNKAMDDGLLSASVTALTEVVTAKGIARTSTALRKFANSETVRSKVLKGFGIAGDVALRFTGEGWEEALGQIASNIALGEPWDKGVGASFVQALTAVENVPNFVALSSDVKAMIAEDQANQQAQSSSQQAQPTTQSNGQADQAQTEQTTPVQPGAEAPDAEPVAETENTPPTETVTQGQPSFDADALYAEFGEIQDQLAKGGVDVDRLEARAKEIQSYFDVIDDDGNIVDNTFNYAQWDLNRKGILNESGSNNRNGSENADGQTVGQGANEPNTGGAERSNETSQPVPPTETETTTAGHNQSDTTPVADLTQQPDDNSQTSDTTGTDGRTGETDGQGVDQGELGEPRGEQNREPTETARPDSTDTRVPERTQSDSERETLDREAQDLFGKPFADLDAQDQTEVKDIVDRRAKIAERNKERELDEPVADIGKLSDERIANHIERLSKRLLHGGVYQNVGGKFSPHFQRDLDRLKLMIDEQARRKGVDSPADRLIQRIKSEVKQIGNNPLNSTTYTDPIVAIYDNAEQLIKDIMALSKDTYGNVKNAYNAVKDKIKAFVENVRQFLIDQGLAHLARKGDRKRAKMAKQKAKRHARNQADLERMLADAVTTLDDAPTKSEQLMDFNKWKKTLAGYVKDVKDLIKDVLPKERRGGPSVADELGGLFNPKKGIGGQGLYDPKTATNSAQHSGKKSEPKPDDKPDDKPSGATRTEPSQPDDKPSEPSDVRTQEPDTDKGEPNVDSVGDTPVQAEPADNTGADTDTVESKQTNETSQDRLTEIRQELSGKANSPENQEAVFMAKTADQFNSVEELSNETKRLMEMDLGNIDRNTRLWQKHNELVDQRKGRKGWGKKAQKEHTGVADGAKLNLSTVIWDAERAYRERLALAENVAEETKQEFPFSPLPSVEQKQEPPRAKNKLDRHVEKQNRLNRTIDSVGENVRQEDQLRAELKKRYPDVDVDKLFAVTGQINDYSAESHTQYQERVAKGHNENTVVKELAEVQFAIANSRGAIKTHPNDTKPPVPSQWQSIIRNGKKKTSRWVKDGSLPFTKEQKERIVNAQENFDWGVEPEQAYQQVAESTDTQDQITTLLADMQSGQFELTIPNITEQAVENALLEFSPEQQAEIREQAREFAVDDDGYPLSQDEEVSNAQLAGIAIHNRQGAKGLLKRFFDKLYSILASVVAVVSVGVMTVPTDAHAQQHFATYTEGERIQGVSQDVSNTANWVKANKDNNGKSFVVADKDNGKIHIFDKDGKLVDTQNALFGMNKGNDNSFGNTPSGRFSLGKVDTKTLGKKDQEVFGDSVLAFKDTNSKANKLAKDGRIIAMHRVVNTPQRKQALTTATANDNFLTHGCINVPTAFYNSAVDNLDGAMFYVLDNTTGEQNSKATQSQSKSSTGAVKPKFEGAVKSNFGGAVKPKFSKKNTTEERANNIAKAKAKLSLSITPLTDYNDVALDKTKTEKILKKVLGKLADNVVVISQDDFAQAQGFDRIRNSGIEGAYDPQTQTVYIVADNIHAQDGLTAEERLAHVAWHELYHHGLDVKFGDQLRSVLTAVDDNPFINELADKIAQDRLGNELAEVTHEQALEEALVELGSALETGSVKALEKRYGVSIPAEFHSGIRASISRFINRLRSVFGKAIDKPLMSNRQVRNLLKETIADIKPSKKDKAIAKQFIADLQDPDGAFANALMFSAFSRTADFVRNTRDLVFYDDTFNAGHNPQTDPTRATKAKRKGGLSLGLRIWEKLQDSTQVITNLDPQGEGGSLYRAVANFHNKTAQLTREYQREIQAFEKKVIAFAHQNKDVFKRAIDRKQADVTVQRVTTALRAITGGNQLIRENLQVALLGKKDANGNTIVKGLYEKRNEVQGYINAYRQSAQGLQAPPYLTRQLANYEREIANLLAIQDKFDQDNYKLLSTDPNHKDRENWRGYDGYTMAEAEKMLQDMHAKGLIDNDVTNGLTKVEYTVDKVIGQDDDGNPLIQQVKHYSYDPVEVKKLFTGKIEPIVTEYVKISQDMHQFTVDKIGAKKAGGDSSAMWEVGTMGKVREMYSTQEKDANGNIIPDSFVVNSTTDVDEIISMRQAAEYTSKRHGRAWTGGSALEQLNWRLSLTAQQVASEPIGRAMLDLHHTHPDRVRVYRLDDQNYTMQKGIVVERPKLDSQGNQVLDGKGNPVTELVKVSFADNYANDALFGDNIYRPDRDNGGYFALAMRAIPVLFRTLTKWNAMNLTASPGFAVTNAFKGYKEKLNQMYAWDKNSPWVKAMTKNTDLFKGGVIDGAKLEAYSKAYLAKQLVNPRTLARETAGIIFATKMINSAGTDFIAEQLSKIGNVQMFNWVKQELDKLQEIYERGGLSSRAEDLIHSVQTQKMKFARGNKLNALIDGFNKTLEATTVVTMSQELVSTLIMTDYLTSVHGMDRNVAIDANLHFMNFNKRGTSWLSNFLRNYTMFANAIAQGARAFERSYFYRTPDGKLKMSKGGWQRLARNVMLAVGTHLLAKMLAEKMCPDKAGMMNQVSQLNPYQLLREIPLANGCNEYYRYPVEYGAGMFENAVGVGLVQLLTGSWSLGQTVDFIKDALKDNASPIGLAIGETDDVFGSMIFNVVYPLLPDPLRAYALAYGGLDEFGNRTDAKFSESKEYKPTAGKPTTDKAWFETAEWAYNNLGMNITPEDGKILVTGPFRGIFRELLTYVIEQEPKKKPSEIIAGKGSVYRKQEEHTVAYTMAVTKLHRYNNLYRYYIQATQRDKELPDETWLEENGIELSPTNMQAMEYITEYLEAMKDKKLDQDTRYEYNMEFVEKIRKLENDNAIIRQ